jgi:crotonobetainyl-CoA:carnitine CoA-transferase CaiB-like acyl-CoA transferase
MPVFQRADVWAAPVLDWPQLLASEAFRRLDMIQTVRRDDGLSLRTTRSPIRIDEQRAAGERAAPRIGEHTNAIRDEFGL